MKEATDAESQVLDVCLDWSRGVATPLPAHLVELYRTMRTAYDLPSRPGA